MTLFIYKIMSSKKKEMTPDECIVYANKIKEQTRLRQQRYIERKKANGEYEAFNAKRTVYKKDYRQKLKDTTDNKADLRNEYNLKTLKELKDIGKTKGLTKISKTNKTDLIEMLINI
jgi:hypothetical protein